MIQLSNVGAFGRIRVGRHCIRRDSIAYFWGRYFRRPLLGRDAHRQISLCFWSRIPPSVRPDQFLQLEQVIGILLPTLDMNVLVGIAGAMQQK